MPSHIRLRRGLKLVFVDAAERVQAMSNKALILALMNQLPPGKQERFLEDAARIQRDLDAVSDQDSLILDVPPALVE